MRENFPETLEQLIEKDSDDFTIAKLFKEEKAVYFASLDRQFSPQHTRSFLIAHAREIEEFIARLYRFVLRSHFGDFTPPFSALPIAFLALGSFGREQCAPFSDIDLMIVYKEVAGYNIKPIIERILYLAWDAGLHLGHRVHTTAELEAAAKSDLTIKTAMLEGRFFYGSRILQVEIEGALNRIRHHNQREYIALKIDEYNARRAKKPITMEPDIKEATGGLRDANTLFWIAKVLYGVSSTKDLVGSAIEEEDYRTFHQALDMLFRVRVALHLLTRKKVDSLLFQYQREVAQLLGFSDTKTRKAERFLLKKLLHSLAQMNRHCAFYIAKLTEPNFAIRPSNLKLLVKEAFDAPIGTEFDISFVMALHRAKLPQRLSRESRQIIWAFFLREDTHLFIEALAHADKLELFFEPLKHILYLAQFDGYHTRPVDEHSILTLRSISAFDGSLRKLYETLSQSDRALLRLVALLHDCGKGGTQDHSEVGAKRFAAFARILGLSEEQVELGAHLIRIHTHMSSVARTEDIYSDRVILAFAARVGDKRTLLMLYLLTIADMRSVSHAIYTHFIAELLRELFQRTQGALGKKEQLSEAALRMRKERQLVAYDRFAALSPQLQKHILGIDSTFFFLKYKPREIVDYAQKASEIDRVGFIAISQPVLTLDIISKVPFNLGWLLGKLSWLDLGAMEIFKLFDGAKLFRMFFRKPLEEPIGDIATLVENGIDMSRTMKYPHPSIKKKEITIDCAHSPSYAKMSIDTQDQQGLMAFIIDVFDRRGIDIATAKISTIKRHANDLFLIEKSSGFCKASDEVLDELTRSA
ncbi:nucleotidyltransferase [Campylobacterota bacterium]|nr:nucleotidyltransferase [Campylobacterota bacterium]